MYSNFIGTIPRELDEAAMIDGCSRMQVFFRIILPSLKATTASVIIWTSVGIWNDYQFQLYFLQKPQFRTITLAITTFVLTGLEHSIANMAYFALHALLNGGADWAAMGWNLLWVTLGNLLGGAVLLGLPLWYAAEPEKTQSFS